jgi:hypothetical protein
MRTSGEMRCSYVSDAGVTLAARATQTTALLAKRSDTCSKQAPGNATTSHSPRPSAVVSEGTSAASLTPTSDLPNRRFATRGKPWTAAEIDILRRGIYKTHDELLPLLPGRTKAAVQGRRNKIGYQHRIVPWTTGEDEEIRVAGKRTGSTGLHRLLPHRTITQIQQRARKLRVELFNRWEQPLAIVGEPLADAIRKRANEDGISMRGLDRELGTSAYFTNVASLRANRGSPPYMPAIRKAIEFFEAELVTGPDGTITIDWKDE